MTNLMFVTIDDYLSLAAWPIYQDVAITPHMDALQQNSANFSSAYADIAVCNPSRTALLTGQTPWQTGVTNNSQQMGTQVDLQAETLPGILQSAGMYTAIGGKIFHDFRGNDQASVSDEILDSDGLRSSVAPEFEQVQHVAYGTTTQVLSDDVLSNSVDTFLHNYTSDAPFALFAGIYRPHIDWIVPQEYIDMYDGIDIPIPDFVDTADREGFINTLRLSFHESVIEANAWEDLVKFYLASMTYADAKLGEMLAALESSGHADDTVVVVLSDHGYHLGEAGLWHKFTTYEQATRVPLMISVPGEAPLEVTAPVNLSNVTATVLELLDMTPTADMQSSLTPYLEGQTPTGDEYAVTWSGAAMTIRTDEYRYTRYEGGAEQLFDMQADIMGQNNLAPTRPDLISEFRTLASEATPEDLFVRPEGPVTGTAENSYYYFGTEYFEITDPGGIDTVFISSDFTLPEGLENLEGRDIGVGLTLEGNTLVNRLAGTRLNDEMFGRQGDDFLKGNNGDDVLHGGEGDDELNGVNDHDRLLGNAGNDLLLGEHGDDILFGGDGDDWLNGGSGRDRLCGERGNDYLDGDANPDQLDGGVGNDILHGGQGNDIIIGGLGFDTAIFSGLRSSYSVLTGGRNFFTIDGIDGRDSVRYVEVLQFDDQKITVDEFFNPGSNPTPIALGETLEGNPAGGPLDGGAGNDTINTTGGAEIISLNAGADRIVGRAEDHFGDTLTDFGTDDSIVFRDATLNRSQITFSGTPSRLEIDTDGDGTADGSVTLQGDFSNGDFMVVSYRGETTVTFSEFLPLLEDKASVDPNDINGIVNTEFLEGDGNTDFVVTMRDLAAAGFANTLGVYEVTADGEITDVRLIVDNAKASNPDPILINNVEAGNQIGFFLVQNGARWASRWDETDTFDFVDSFGNASFAFGGREALLRVNGAVQNLTIFHSFDDDLNPGNHQHVLSGVEAGGTQMTVGFEDLVGGGDQDYGDVVFTIERYEAGTFIL